MKHPNIGLPIISAMSALVAIGLDAATFTGPDGGFWGEGANWDTGTVPTASEEARMTLTEDRTIDINGNYSIRQLQDGFAAGSLTLGGTGSLTIDINQGSPTWGLENSTGEAGGILQINSNIVINNSAGLARTTMRNGNTDSNIIRFNPGSSLVLTSGAQTTGTFGTIEFNGTISGEQPLFIGSTNVSFGEGHDSTELGSVVFFLNSLLQVNGGTVLAPGGTKFQVNGVGAELELNGANAVNGANISVGGSNDLHVDVNANQENMGAITLPVSGQLTIDVDPSVTNLSFSNSSAEEWGAGTVTISGFKEGTIRFGTDGTGLTGEQLAAINGGIYNINSDGYLTLEAVSSTWAGYPIVDNFADTGDWMGWIYVGSGPWVWSLALNTWIYLPEEEVHENGAWAFFVK